MSKSNWIISLQIGVNIQEICLKRPTRLLAFCFSRTTTTTGNKKNHRLNQRATETSVFNSWDTGEVNLLYVSLLNTPQAGKPSIQTSARGHNEVTWHLSLSMHIYIYMYMYMYVYIDMNIGKYIIYIPGTQMTLLVLVGKDPVLEGLSLKIEDQKAPGKYADKCTRYIQKFTKSVSLFVVSSSFLSPLNCTIITTCFSNHIYETSVIVYVLSPAF